MLRPLKPMTPRRQKWEAELQQHLCLDADLDNGDAQGLIEANQELVDASYIAGDTPIRAAGRLVNAPHHLSMGAPPHDENVLVGGSVTGAVGNGITIGADGIEIGLNPEQLNAIHCADSWFKATGMPTYTQVFALLRRTLGHLPTSGLRAEVRVALQRAPR